MNPIILILLIFALIGMIDKMSQNRLKLAQAFDKGIVTMGDFMVSISGFYCVAIAFLQSNPNLFSNMPFDPNILIGSLLAPDLGGYSIIKTLCENETMLIYSGVLLSSTLGCLISFQLPIFLNGLDKDDLNNYLKGIIYGLIALVPMLIIFALIMKLDHFIITLLPVLIICACLFSLFLLSFELLIKLLTFFSRFVQIIGHILFIMVCLTFFFDLPFTNDQLIEEALSIVFQMSIIVCGSLVLSEIILRHFKKQIKAIADFLKLDEYAVIGLLLSLATSIAMLPLFERMSKKGKIVNAAFSLSGAFVFGGQLGFISSVSSNLGVTLFIVFKFLAGILAVIVAGLFERRQMIK